MTYKFVSKLIITGSDNGLLPGQRQVIVWTNAGILLIGPLGNKLKWNPNQDSYIFFKENALENVVWKMAAILSRPHCVNTVTTTLLSWWWYCEYYFHNLVWQESCLVMMLLRQLLTHKLTIVCFHFVWYGISFVSTDYMSRSLHDHSDYTCIRWLPHLSRDFCQRESWISSSLTCAHESRLG